MIFKIVALLAKGIELLTYKNTLLYTKIYVLHTANKVLNKYCRAKKTCIRQRGILIVKDVYNILGQTKVNKQIQRDKYSRRGIQGNKILSIQRYSIYKNTSYNLKIYQDVIII